MLKFSGDDSDTVAIAEVVPGATGPCTTLPYPVTAIAASLHPLSDKQLGSML